MQPLTNAYKPLIKVDLSESGTETSITSTDICANDFSNMSLIATRHCVPQISDVVSKYKYWETAGPMEW